MNAVVIDDDSSIRQLLGRVLTRKGFDFTAYSTPADCTLYAEDGCPCSWKGICPDVIISDFNMPGVNGVEFIGRLRAKKCTCKNIAVISGSWDEQQLRQMVPDGVNVFSKPVQLSRIGAWLDQIKATAGEVACRADRRSSARYPCDIPLDVYRSAPGLLETVQGMCRNISRGGMLVHCTSFLASRTLCQVAFQVPAWLVVGGESDRDVMVAARVRHSNRDASLYGLQFLEALPT